MEMPMSSTLLVGDELGHAVQQMVSASSENEFFNQLIPAIKDTNAGGKTSQLLQLLALYSGEREAEIERICSDNHQDFISSVNQLLEVREGTVTLTSEILELNQAIQASTEHLAEHKKALVESRGVRQNIDEANEALQGCLEVLRLTNQVHDLLSKKNYYSALRVLDELRNVHRKEIVHFKIAEMVQRSVPITQKMIADAVMTDLNTWLFRIRETSQFLGEVAFYHTEQRRTRQKEGLEAMTNSSNFKLNSAIELVSNEDEEFDILNNEDVQVDFTPLFECLHIHNALDQRERFRAEYAATRRQQKDLLIPTSMTLADTEGSNLSELLEGIAGFAIVEKATMKKIPDLRSPLDVEAVHEVTNAEFLLKIKEVIALFIQTMDIVSTDDYMPMPIGKLEEYDKVVNVSWYTPSKAREELQ
ncbi:MAG: hypothetical protein Q9190_002208 [Brigantiaea leucoxantha]